MQTRVERFNREINIKTLVFIKAASNELERQGLLDKEEPRHTAAFAALVPVLCPCPAHAPRWSPGQPCHGPRRSQLSLIIDSMHRHARTGGTATSVRPRPAAYRSQRAHSATRAVRAAQRRHTPRPCCPSAASGCACARLPAPFAAIRPHLRCDPSEPWRSRHLGTYLHPYIRHRKHDRPAAGL